MPFAPKKYPRLHVVAIVPEVHEDAPVPQATQELVLLLVAIVTKP